MNFMTKNNYRKSRITIWATINTLKNSKNSKKISRDILEHEEPNEVFGAHEKIFQGI
jgi:hypothetical protein